LTGDTLGLPKHTLESGSAHVEIVIAPTPTIGVAWSSESVFQILISSLI